MKIYKGYSDTSFGQIHYRYCGEGDPIILLHSTPRSSVIFEKLMFLLAKKHSIFALDTLGFGQSDKLPDNFKIELLADSVIEFCENNELKDVSIFGLHTGNKIAAAIAISSKKELIKNIIVCGMSHSLILDNKEREIHINNLLQKNHQKKSNIDDWGRTFENIQNSWWSKKLSKNTGFSKRDYEIAEQESIDFINARNSMDKIYESNFIFDFQKTIFNIKIPTLVIELLSDMEKHIGPQGCHFKNIDSNFFLVELENAMAGVLSSNGRKLDVLENKSALLAKYISKFSRNSCL